MRTSILITLLCFCQVTLAGENSEVVERFVGAFNDKNVDAMLELASPDIQWMSVEGGQSAIEASSHAELRSAMEGYFQSMPSARSEIRTISESGPYVHTLEQAFWRAGEDEKSQCSMAMYELADRKIRYVWYFPAHACP